MKKTIRLFCIFIATMLSVVGCRKEDRNEVNTLKVIEVTLEQNEPYSYRVPKSESADPYQLSKQASHFLRSDLTSDFDSGTLIYQYTPSKNYIGNDEVTLTSIEENQHGHHQKKGLGFGGGCHEDESGTTHSINIRFTIKNSGINTIINLESK